MLTGRLRGTGKVPEAGRAVGAGPKEGETGATGRMKGAETGGYTGI